MLSKVFYFQITMEMNALRTHRIQILQGLQGIVTFCSLGKAKKPWECHTVSCMSPGFHPEACASQKCFNNWAEWPDLWSPAQEDHEIKIYLG